MAFAHDAGGRLVRRDSAGGTTSNFLWDGPSLFAELGPAGDSTRSQYSYYPGLDHLHAFAFRAAGGWTTGYAHTDALGNVRAIANGVNYYRRYEYDEWGVGTSLETGSPLAGDLDRARWKGALYAAPEAGLYYLRNRWYEPRSGRFVSEGPIGVAAGLNAYLLAGANPVTGSDPSGLSPCRVHIYLPYVVDVTFILFPFACADKNDRPLDAPYSTGRDPTGQNGFDASCNTFRDGAREVYHGCLSGLRADGPDWAAREERRDAGIVYGGGYICTVLQTGICIGAGVAATSSGVAAYVTAGAYLGADGSLGVEAGWMNRAGAFPGPSAVACGGLAAIGVCAAGNSVGYGFSGSVAAFGFPVAMRTGASVTITTQRLPACLPLAGTVLCAY